jgi:predicted lipoprotein with Yx(FWY)xxD motif
MDRHAERNSKRRRGGGAPFPDPRSESPHLRGRCPGRRRGHRAAACGGSSSSSSKKSTTTTSKGAAAAAVVKTANSSTLGTIVVDGTGKTAYTLTNGSQQVPCSGACLQVWPAVSLPAGATKASGSGVKNVAAMGTQVTINGAPVYTFSGDAAAGSTNGEGITSFGGTWHVVKAGGSTGGGGSTSTTAKSSASGY